MDHRVEREKRPLGAITFELNKVIRVKDNRTEYVNYCANENMPGAFTCYRLDLPDTGARAAECTQAAEQVLSTMRLSRP